VTTGLGEEKKRETEDKVHLSGKIGIKKPTRPVALRGGLEKKCWHRQSQYMESTIEDPREHEKKIHELDSRGAATALYAPG